MFCKKEITCNIVYFVKDAAIMSFLGFLKKFLTACNVVYRVSVCFVVFLIFFRA